MWKTHVETISVCQIIPYYVNKEFRYPHPPCVVGGIFTGYIHGFSQSAKKPTYDCVHRSVFVLCTCLGVPKAPLVRGAVIGDLSQ